MTNRNKFLADENCLIFVLINIAYTFEINVPKVDKYISAKQKTEG